jgi:catechol 2,3-dioxygenase-like lactoylglutathione lyase family enzyme
MANQVATQAIPEADSLPHLALRAIDITVADIDATLAFYAGVVPLKVLRRFSLAAAEFGPELLGSIGGTVEIAVVQVPTGILQLMRFPNGQTPNEPVPVIGPGYTHICYQSPASDPSLGKLMARGLSLISRCDEHGVDLGGYGVRYCYGRDPEGRMIEVEILDQPRRGEPSWLAHIANCAHDHALLQNFYRSLLGKEPYRTLPVSSRPTFDQVADLDAVAVQASWFRVHNLDIELWTYTNPPTPVPIGRRRLDMIGYGSFALEVTDLAAETSRLSALGIPLVGTVLDLGGWRTQYAADPEGNLFSVQQRIDAPQAESGMAFDPI